MEEKTQGEYASRQMERWGCVSSEVPFFSPQKDVQRMQTEKSTASHLPSLSTPHCCFTPLSPRLGLPFPEKGISYKRGAREKQIIQLFVFFLQTAAVSHVASPIHTLTPSEPLPYPNLLKNNTWDLPQYPTHPTHPLPTRVWVAGCVE